MNQVAKSFVIITLCFQSFFSVNAQEAKVVTLIVNGQGKTKDEAKQNALRNAIEQSFGAFISSHTELLNDNLIKDEIISVSSGNIQKYEVLSEEQLPQNLGYSTTLKATVSVSKLVNFCESKGMKVEINGSLFAFNVIQKELSSQNEKKALVELISMAKIISPKIFDYTLVANEPLKNDWGSYSVPIKVVLQINNNWESYNQFLYKVLQELALNKNELEDYNKMNIETYSFDFYTTKTALGGDYTRYKGHYYDDGSGTKLNESDYDKYVFDEVSIIQKEKNQIDMQERRMSRLWKEYENNSTINYNLNSVQKKYTPLLSWFNGNKPTIIEKKITSKNYKKEVLFFRSDISQIINNIKDLIELEAYKYTITNSKGLRLYSSVDYNIILNPLSAGGGEAYKGQNFNYEAETNQNIEANDRTFNSLSNKSVIIHNIKPSSIVGFFYTNLLFSLEDLKTLSKLEIKKGIVESPKKCK